MGAEAEGLETHLWKSRGSVLQAEERASTKALWQDKLGGLEKERVSVSVG